MVDGKKINFSKVKFDSKWKLIDGSLVSYEDKPAFLKINLNYEESIEIDFVSHEWSGIAEVFVDSKEATIDLFSSNPTTYKYIAAENGYSYVSIKKFIIFFIKSALLSFLILYLIHFLEKIYINREKINNKNYNLEKVTIFFVSAFSLSLYLLAFYPGIMTNDSFDQWNQSSNFVFKNIHPVFHTYILFLIKTIWSYPAMVVIVQVLLFSLVLTYCFGFLYKLGVNKYFIYVYVLLMCSFPLNGLMTVTLWKDVMYGIFFMLLTITLYKLEILGYKSFVKSKINLLCLIISLICVGLLRQNGILIFLILFVSLFFIYIKNRKIIFSIALSALMILLIRGPFYNYLKAQPSPDYLFYFTHIQFISSIVESKAELNGNELNLINNLLPIDKWSAYYSPVTSWNYFISPEFNLGYLSSHKKEMNKLFFDLAVKNPKVFFSNLERSTSYIWQIKYPLYVTYGTTVPTDEQNKLIWDKYDLKPKYILPSYRNIILRTINKIYNDRFLWVLLTPALYLYLCSFFFILYLYRNKMRLFLVFLPVYANIFSFIISPSSPEFRYAFPVVLTTFFVFIIAFLRINTKKEIKNSNT